MTLRKKSHAVNSDVARLKDGLQYSVGILNAPYENSKLHFCLPNHRVCSPYVPLEVPDQHFPTLQIFPVGAGVGNLGLFKPEALEGLPDAGRVVQGKDELPLHARQQLRQLAEVLPAEEALAVVVLIVPVRRIDVEEGGGLVVTPDDFRIRQALHIGSRQTQVGGGERFFDAQQVELRALHGGVAKGRVREASAEALLLQVVEARRPLNVR